jgi:hypothetical protein
MNATARVQMLYLSCQCLILGVIILQYFGEFSLALNEYLRIRIRQNYVDPTGSRFTKLQYLCVGAC